MELLDDGHLPQAAGGHARRRVRDLPAAHPWIADYELSPKSVVRDMYERAMTFTEYIGSTASPGPRAWCCATSPTRTRRCGRPCPTTAKTEDLTDLIEWLGETVRQVDSSLIDEWERLRNPESDDPRGGQARRRARPGHRQPPRVPRAGAQRHVPPGRAGRAAPLRRAGRASTRDAGWDADAWDEASTATSTSTTRSAPGRTRAAPAMLIIDESRRARRWTVRQIFDDPATTTTGASRRGRPAASDEAGDRRHPRHQGRPAHLGACSGRRPRGSCRLAT